MSDTTQNAARHFNLSDWALRQPSLVVFLMLLTIAAGVWSWLHLGRNEDPPFTIKTMVVSAVWPGATITDTVGLLTDKIEQKLEETPYLDRLDSYTRAGETVIMVNLRDDTPPAAVEGIWYQVRKKVGDMAATLPAGIRGPYFDDEFGETFGIIYGFVADGFTDRELRDRLDEIRADLLRTADIGKVRLLGVQEEQIVIEFSPRRLAALGLDPQQVTAALAAQNAVVPAGIGRSSEEKTALRVTGAFATEAALKDVTLRVADRFVPLTDIATVTRKPIDPPAPVFRVNGERALGLAVSMAPSGDLLAFGDAVKRRMGEIAARLPHGIEMVEVADQTVVVHNAVGGFVKVLMEAIAIVLAVSFLSLGARAGLVVGFSIPLVLALTFVGMELAGIGLQRISLGALIIALGLLVDDAMITVEAMVSRLEAGWDLRRAATYAYDSTAFPMLTGTLVMIAGFIPVGFAASSAGEYCFSLFTVVLISLSASWIVAVLFSPLIGTWLLPRRLSDHGHVDGRAMRTYSAALGFALRHRWSTAGAVLVALVVAALGATRLETQFFPPSDRPELLVGLTLPPNASIDATDRRSRRLEEILKADPDVVGFSTYVGSGAIRFYLPMDVLLTNDDITQTVVVTRGLAERDAVKARLEQVFEAEFADLVTRATPLELGPPVGWPLKYRVTGPELAGVRRHAEALANLVGSDPRSRDINLTSGAPQRNVTVTVRQTEARAVGITSQDLASMLAAIFSGTTVTTVRDGTRLVDVVARATVGERDDLATVANLQLSGPNGVAIPLGQIADIAYGVEDPIVWRRQREPIVTVQADVDPRIQPATVSAALAPKIAVFAAALPPGYRVAEGGAVEESNKGNDSVFAVVPLMSMAMVSLLMVQLRSFSRTFVALAMAPFGLIGVVAAMLPLGAAMGFVAQLGVIALAGMIIRNAVILIEEADRGVASGAAPVDAVTDASRRRARPIVLTACAAILGMIPIAHQVFWGPMAYAIIGGLTAATVLTLTLLPVALVGLLEHEMAHAKRHSSIETPEVG